jgi:hypothetical protein
MAVVPMKKVRFFSAYLIKVVGKSIKFSCISTEDIDRIYLPLEEGNRLKIFRNAYNHALEHRKAVEEVPL